MFLIGILHNVNITAFFMVLDLNKNLTKSCVAMHQICFFSINLEILILKGVNVLPKMESELIKWAVLAAGASVQTCKGSSTGKQTMKVRERGENTRIKKKKTWRRGIQYNTKSL